MAPTRRGAWPFAVGFVWGTACFPTPEYLCQTNKQCVAAENTGVCQYTGLCSFPDDRCPSNQRYTKFAGALSETCVPPAGGSGSGGGTDSGENTSDSTTTTDPGSTGTSTASTGGTVATVDTSSTDTGADTSGGGTSATGDPSEVCDGMDDDGDGLVDEVSPTNTVCNDCDLEQFEGHAYWFCPSYLAWSDARDACEALGADLASVHDLAGDQFLRGHLPSDGGSFRDRFWLGGNDIAVEGTFEWTDDTPWDYSAWSPGEPNNAGMGQDCMGIRTDFPGWNDAPCTTSIPFVCRAPHSN